jgi:hypothetical protein
LEARFLTTRNAELSSVEPPIGFTSAEGDNVGKLVMSPGEYCGFRIAEPYPDWSEFSLLRFDVYYEQDSAIDLAVRIDDIHHNQEYEDRYNGVYRIEQGVNRIAVDLQDVRHAPSGREMDMTAIRYVLFFTYMPSESLTVYIDGIKLQ